jgi:hypothetical protein
MLERAIKLQKYIDQWIEKEIALKGKGHSRNDNSQDATSKDLKKLRLTTPEWKHLTDVREMLANFKTATSSLSQISYPFINHIWSMYNKLFNFLDDITSKLGDDDHSEGEYDDWPDIVRAAAEKGREKLRKYYSRTGDEQGYLFNCATILDPRKKLTAYEVCLLQ